MTERTTGGYTFERPQGSIVSGLYAVLLAGLLGRAGAVRFGRELSRAG